MAKPAHEARRDDPPGDLPRGGRVNRDGPCWCIHHSPAKIRDRRDQHAVTQRLRLFTCVIQFRSPKV